MGVRSAERVKRCLTAAALLEAKRSPEFDDLPLQVSLMAGAGFEPATFGL
jgi:hypothetical protein